MSNQAEEITHHEHPLVENPLGKCISFWQEAINRPGDFLQPSNRPGAAFGNGVILFSDENKLTEMINKSAIDDHFSIAGVKFTIQELKHIGGFYKYLQEVGYGKIKCMDERIDLDAEHADSGIHEHCGAAGGIGASCNNKSGVEIEDIACQLTNEKDKAEIIKGMEHHEALAIKIDLSNELYDVKPGMNPKLRDNAALPFHISLPLEHITKYTNNNHLTIDNVLLSLLRFNVQIAVNIIKNNHNIYQQHAQEGIVITSDQRTLNKEANQSLLNEVYAFIGQLSQGQPIKQLEIN
jgi:hypothetical protein